MGKKKVKQKQPLFTIEVDYTTGSTFSTHDETNKVGHIWRDYEKCQEALRYIQEHNKYFIDRRWRGPGKDLEPGEWIVLNEYGDEVEYSVNVPNDDGELVVIGAFWVGYFETLHNARIIIYDE